MAPLMDLLQSGFYHFKTEAAQLKERAQMKDKLGSAPRLKTSGNQVRKAASCIVVLICLTLCSPSISQDQDICSPRTYGSMACNQNIRQEPVIWVRNQKDSCHCDRLKFCMSRDQILEPSASLSWPICKSKEMEREAEESDHEEENLDREPDLPWKNPTVID